jgi:large subunit ribosomal protein L35
MPKMKTNSGAKKRLKVRGSGSVKKRSATRRHLATGRTPKNKQQLRGTSTVGKSDENNALRMLCIK